MDPGTAMNVAGLALQLPSLLQLGFQFAFQIQGYCSDFRNANEQADQLAVAINLHLETIRAALKFLQNNEAKFTPRVQEQLADALRQLLRSFRDVSETFSLARAPDESGKLKIRPGRWAMKVKKALEAALEDMQRWQRRFLDYVQILYIAGVHFDDPVAEVNNRLQPPDLEHEKVQELTSNTKALDLQMSDKDFETMACCLLWKYKPGVGRSNILIEDRVILDDENPAKVRSRIEHTSQLLKYANPHVSHVLKCEGFLDEREKRRFRLILNFPPGMNRPRSLRDVLTDESVGMPSLPSRVRLARQIATSVLFTHSMSLVHKSLRPEDIVLFQNAKSNVARLGTPFLSGFSLSRLGVGHVDSSLRSNRDWERALYLHPDRQNTPTVVYTMSHDIYSIGIILLEIGLWQSLIQYDKVAICNVLNQDMLPAAGDEDDDLKMFRDPSAGFGSGHELKKRYEMMAQWLPAGMGNEYAKVVFRCLRVGEDGFVDAEADEEDDVPEETLGLSYIRYVLDGLDDIVV